MAISTATSISTIRPQWYQMLIKEYDKVPVRLKESMGNWFLYGGWREALKHHIKGNIDRVKSILGNGIIIDHHDRIIGDVRCIDVIPFVRDKNSINIDKHKVTADVLVDQTTNTIYYPGMQLPEGGYLEKRNVVLSKEVCHNAPNKNVRIDIRERKP